jgi:hypothetical protein
MQIMLDGQLLGRGVNGRKDTVQGSVVGAQVVLFNCMSQRATTTPACVSIHTLSPRRKVRPLKRHRQGIGFPVAPSITPWWGDDFQASPGCGSANTVTDPLAAQRATPTNHAQVRVAMPPLHD